jgi:hypothetical protein
MSKINVREYSTKTKHGVKIFIAGKQIADYAFYSPGNGSQSAMKHSMNLAKREIEQAIAQGHTLDVDLTDFGGRVIEFQHWLRAQVEAQTVAA